MKADIHPKYVDAEIRCACGNVMKTRSTKPVIIVGICNACHPFYTGTQKFVDTAGRVDKFQQRAAKTLAAQGHVDLVETFAWGLARELLGDARVLRARVRVEKPQALAPDAQAAGVEVVLARGVP